MEHLHPTLQQLGRLGLIPVIAIGSVDHAVPLATALSEGGLPCAEVTFRTSAAEASLSVIAKAFPNMALGAGTVLTTDQVDRALGAGATYIVSPGLNPKVVEHCMAKGVPVTPGVVTPSEIERALELGLKVVKFFPAEASGGVEYLKAISAPYKGLQFIPTGGINEKNLASYLQLPMVLACGGSWMVSPKTIADGRFDEIRSLTASAVTAVRSIRPQGEKPGST